MIQNPQDILGPGALAKKAEKKQRAALSEEEKRRHRCCFTGHRPQGITRPLDDVKVDLENMIMMAIQEGYTTFVTGMCIGVDIWAGEIVQRLKSQYPGIRLIAAVPYPGFPDRWPPEWKNKYDRLLKNADAVRIISPEYEDQVFQIRNEWMVDHSAKVIAVSNGRKSGTQNTIAYARKKRIPVATIKA
ncbi:MAG: DUF1273 family protein [Clostridia bacterium]|nr:DUF1273 family protein [Clostridia bacterium]